MGEVPTVSVVVPTLDEEAYIGDVLAAFAAQTYPAERMDLIVADGGSHDRTREIVEAFARSAPNVRLIDNPDTHQSAGLNRAAAVSTADVLVRWDAHARYPTDYVEAAVRVLQEPDVDVVGGYWEPIGDTTFGDWAAAAMASRIGVGTGRFSADASRGLSDSAMCAIMERTTFHAVSGYDTAMRPAGEDADIAYRIRERGGAVMFDPSVRAVYVPRGTASGLATQYYGYGIAKANLLIKHGTFPSPRPMAPAALFLGLVIGAAVPRLRRQLRFLIAAYGVGLGAGAVVTVGGPVTRRVGAALAASIMHLSYGAGLWAGLARRLVGRQD